MYRHISRYNNIIAGATALPTSTHGGVVVGASSASHPRHFASSSSLFNQVQVGGTASVSPTGGTPSIKVEFGSVRSRERRRAERLTRNKQILDRLNTLHETMTAPTEEVDEEAKTILNHSYGFAHKPPACYFYRQFLSELRRYEMDWESANYARTVMGFKITDRGIDGKAESPVVICNLRGDNDKANSFGDFHQGVNKLLLETTATTYTISFKDEFGLAFEVRLSSVFPLAAPTSAETVSGKKNRRSAADAANDNDDDEDNESYADIIKREVDDALKRPFIAAPGGPFRRYTQRINVDLINVQSGVEKCIIKDLSVQAFGFAYISGVSRFVKAKEHPGASQTNREVFFTKADYDFMRYNFVTFRQQLGMKPIDNMDLNMMLPPYDN